MKKLFILSIILFSISASAGTKHSCRDFGKTFSITIPDFSDERYGYNIQRLSCKQLVDRHWRAFGFEKRHWDGGLGYYDKCNTQKPLNRMLRALELLRNARTSRAPAGSFLNEAYSKSSRWIDHLRFKCAISEDDRAIASHANRSKAGQFFGGSHGSGDVTFYLNAFDNNIARNAGYVVHEARHRHKGHNAAKTCPRKGSCDSHWGYNGANTLQIMYLWQMATHSGHVSKKVRQMSLDSARYSIKNAFKVTPRIGLPQYAPTISNNTSGSGSGSSSGSTRSGRSNLSTRRAMR